MVCIYCGLSTRVTNSRPQKRRNGVWRRRACTGCGAIFTSVEQADYEMSLLFCDGMSHNVPFERDRLFISLYDVCRHRPEAVSDAAALTATVINQLLHSDVRSGSVQRADVIRRTSQTLAAFDQAAKVMYDAYHSV